MWHEALRSRKARVLLAACACYLAWQAWLGIAAPAKVAAFPGRSERVNILVTLPFPPERFHIQQFQAFGRVSGSQDNTVEVRGVRRADLAAIARPYWVRRVEPLPAGG
jgi:hypothetical protein